MSNFAIIGKPNCGKSLLFNTLTGSDQKVANYPGVTVSIQTGIYKNITIIDFPGVYSLQPITEDERIAVDTFHDALSNTPMQGILIVLDGTRMESSLHLALQIIWMYADKNVPILLVINMVDLLKEHHITIDIDALSNKLHVPIIAVSAKTQENISTLTHWLEHPTISNLQTSTIFSSTTTMEDIPSLATDICAEFVHDSPQTLHRQNSIDNILLSGFWGTVIFFVVLLVLFQSIFSWATPFMDGIEWVITWTAEQSSSIVPSGVLASFVSDALIGGVGSFLVFVPQIFMVSLLIGFLEDSGYMARMAVICHRPLQFFGLSGKSIVPLLSGHACAIPAIYAARTIESPKKRLITMMAVPLTSCSARLPVYGLLVATTIPNIAYMGGMIGSRGLAFFVLYMLGIAGALLVSSLLAKFSMQTTDSPFVIELPAYRIPNLRGLLKQSYRTAMRFVTQAGWMIFSVNAIIWFLGYFPNGEGNLQNSYLAMIGHMVEPLFSPLGLDWKFAVAILMSFLAREVFVGALGTMYGLEDNDSLQDTLADKLQSNGLSLGSGIAVLIFYVFAMQCVSTLAVLKQETGSWKIPVSIFAGYNVLAYLLALGCVAIF